MQENPTSHEALHDEEPSEEVTGQVCAESHGKNITSFGDTLTLQAILCMLLAIGFIAANILNGGLAADIFELYESKFNSDSTAVNVLAAIVDFLGTAPIDNV